jgi:DNA gyrase/topoisomerase IV subunit A
MTNSPQPVSIAAELSADFLTYSTAIFNRALPDIVDGLKVAQRRVLLSLRDLHLGPDSPYCKVTRVEGHTLGSYHPQGGCAGTIINLGQESSLRYTLTAIHGNAGGSIQTGKYIGQMVSDDSSAAPRYLEVRATPLCQKLYLDEIRKGLGEWRDNYDSTSIEPVRVVPALPALLLTGSVGIASGYACSHIPWNLRDVVSATTALIRTPGMTDAALAAKFSNPPEPPAGGRVVRDNNVRSALLTGRGQVAVYGSWEITDSLPWGKRSTRPAIIVTRLASGSSERFLDRVRELADAEKLPGLLDAADHSSRDGIRIVLVTKTVEDRDRLLGVLIHNGTGLRHTHSVNATAVGCDGKPRTVGVRESIRAWYEARVAYLAEFYWAETERLRGDMNRLTATLTILNDLDKFLKTVRAAKDKPDAVDKVSGKWKISPDLARYVIGIPISTLINTERTDIQDRHNKLSAEIDNLTALCTPGPALDTHICAELASLRGLCGPARSVWMEGDVPAHQQSVKAPTEREKMAEEARGIGISSRAFNQWIRDNTGKGKLSDRWSEYKLEHTHRLQMTTRDGKKQRRLELDQIRADAESRGMPRRGQYAWNAFIATCSTLPTPTISAKMDEWLLKLPNSNTSRAQSDPGKSKPRTSQSGRSRSQKATGG